MFRLFPLQFINATRTKKNNYIAYHKNHYSLYLRYFFNYSYNCFAKKQIFCDNNSNFFPGYNRGVRTLVRKFSLPSTSMREETADQLCSSLGEASLNENTANEELVIPSGINPLNPDGTPKTKNQLKNEIKKAAKMEKFMSKQGKVAEMQKASAAGKMKTLDKRGEVDERLLQVPKGEKKPIHEIPMADAYNPKAVEYCWYSWWEAQGFFKPECNRKSNIWKVFLKNDCLFLFLAQNLENREQFVLVVPPPNVTGSLHLGHTLTAAVEDSLARWHRMCGHEVLYVPGSDHAGIATQAVVEKRLAKERKLTKHDLGREAFLAEVWKWKEAYGNRIYDQFRRMGSSVDWERACFTLDPKCVEAVNEAFCRMFDDGLIFRANRLVHWCGKLKTALSDLEVEMKEIEPKTLISGIQGHEPGKKYEFGVMYSFSYKLAEDSSKEIVISTTRPETVFADVAIAVNARDVRYFEFHGKHVIHPVTGASLPVICDDAADPEFGTGALKVSPGHDHIDFEMGKRHGLPCVSVFDADNRLLPICGPQFSGLPRYEAREQVVAFCKQNGTWRGDAPHAMVLPVCTRSGDFVEPRMMPQWWLNCREMAADACEAVRSGALQISPKDHEREWFYWLENIHDWCLSRQLWWGHRVPAYRIIGHVDERGEEIWVAGRSEEEAIQRARARLPNFQGEIELIQDDDVLDTWFSSGLWPLSTLNWPNVEDSDFCRFYPQSILETGSDILFFWVARMVMMGKYLTGQLPFKQILLHAMVRDAYGRKMSKSLGNVIDPLDVIEGCTLEHLQYQLDGGNLDAKEIIVAKEGQKRDFPHGIPECGTDALRFALCSYVAAGRDINMNITRVEGYRRFCNKLWNATKFALMKLGSDYVPPVEASLSAEFLQFCGLPELWILQKLSAASEGANRNFAAFNLMTVTSAAHQFWLYEVCDVFIEAVKPVLPGSKSAADVLYLVLEQGLQLLHPMMPFLTEELWQRLPRRPQFTLPSICLAAYPQALSASEFITSGAAKFEEIVGVVRAVRSAATDRKLPPKTSTIHVASQGPLYQVLKENEVVVQALTKAAVGRVEVVEMGEGEELPLPEGTEAAIKLFLK